MTAIHVEVTAEHIAAAGDDRMAWAQPLEDALRDLTGQEVDIDAGGHDDEPWSVATIGQGAWTIVVDLPQPAHAWLDARWDLAEPVPMAGEPFAFDIEVPDWLIDLVRIGLGRDEDLVTLTEAARALGLSPQTIRSAANQLHDGIASPDALAGRLGIRKVGRDWLVPRDLLDAEVQRRTVAP